MTSPNLPDSRTTCMWRPVASNRPYDTPGWVILHGPDEVAYVYDQDHSGKARAQLIAAAPELLAALEIIYERLTDGRREMDAASLAENAADIAAAIAAARGEAVRS